MMLSLSDRILRRASRRVFTLPDRILRRLAGPERRNDRGTPLDLHTQLMIRLDAAVNRDPLSDHAPQSARARMERSCELIRGPLREVSGIEDRAIGDGIHVRIYTPSVTPAPVLLYLHGGGWVVGSPSSHDALCRRFAADAGRLVLSVDYRLAPEHPFPGPLEDVLKAWDWARENAAALGGDPGNIAMGGDSAGGNLTAAACLVLRDAGRPQPALQLLIYPGTDLHRDTASHRLFSEGYLLTESDIVWYQDHYGCLDLDDPRGSPLLAQDHRNLPPAIVVTAGFDPLRDEGEAYADRLEAAGVPVVRIDAADLVHGFANMDSLPAASGRIDEIVDALGSSVQPE